MLTLQTCNAASGTQQWRVDSHSQWAVDAAGKADEELCLNVGELSTALAMDLSVQNILGLTNHSKVDITTFYAIGTAYR